MVGSLTHRVLGACARWLFPLWTCGHEFDQSSPRDPHCCMDSLLHCRVLRPFSLRCAFSFATLAALCTRRWVRDCEHLESQNDCSNTRRARSAACRLGSCFLSCVTG